MRILLSNDDGISAQGLDALAAELKKLGPVTVVAPAEERSGAGHSLSFFSPLRLKKESEEENLVRYSCSGTPTDSVIMGLDYVMKDAPPQILVSGINRGANLGDDITYSGTASIAMEGALRGIPSIAVSAGNYQQPIHNFHAAAAVVARLCTGDILGRLPQGVFLNVNVPSVDYSELKGVRITHLGKSAYTHSYLEREDNRGQKYFWLLRTHTPAQDDYRGSDFEAIAEGYASITPVHLRLTCSDTMEMLRQTEL